MSDLFDDLQDGNGRDYFYALESAPGSITPLLAELSVVGRSPTIFEQSTVFRSPATAVVTINGKSAASDAILIPITASLSVGGLTPDEYRSLTITPAIPTPDYGELQSTAPSVLFINTVTPAPAVVTLQSLELNVTEGGNIAFVSPGVGAIRVQNQALSLTLVFFETGVGAASISGHAPTLVTAGLIQPQVGQVNVSALLAGIERPFGWIDVDPPSTTVWTTTTGIAA